MTLVTTTSFKHKIGESEFLLRYSANSEDYYKKAIGTQFELCVAKTLLPLSNIFCYHQFKGLYLNKMFEADLLIVVPSNHLLVIETKAYRGNYDLSSNNRYFEKTNIDGRITKVKNPIFQTIRTSRLLGSFLNQRGFDFQIVPLVVFSDGFCISSAIAEMFSRSNVALLNLEHFEQLISHYTLGVFDKMSQSSKLIKMFYSSCGQSPILFDDTAFTKNKNGGSHAFL